MNYDDSITTTSTELDSSTKPDTSTTAPAVIVHLFGYNAREFALIAWGYHEDDGDSVGLLSKLDDTPVASAKGIIPSDYFQIVETEAIESLVDGDGKLALKDSVEGEGKGDGAFWRGYWLLKFGGGGRSSGGRLWRPEVGHFTPR